MYRTNVRIFVLVMGILNDIEHTIVESDKSIEIVSTILEDYNCQSIACINDKRWEIQPFELNSLFGSFNLEYVIEYNKNHKKDRFIVEQLIDKYIVNLSLFGLDKYYIKYKSIANIDIFKEVILFLYCNIVYTKHFKNDIEDTANNFYKNTRTHAINSDKILNNIIPGADPNCVYSNVYVSAKFFITEIEIQIGAGGISDIITFNFLRK